MLALERLMHEQREQMLKVAALFAGGDAAATEASQANDLDKCTRGGLDGAEDVHTAEELVESERLLCQTGAVACEDGTVLLLGGLRTVDGNPYSRSAAVERLDPATGECTPLPPLSQPRTSFCAGLLPDGRVLLAGGDITGRLVEAYDPATGASTPLADLTTPRWGAASCWLPDGRFAVLGGFRAGHCLTSCEAYDPATNAWESLPDLLHARGGCAAWVVGGQVVVAGGHRDGEYLDSVEVLDAGLREWRVLPLRLPRPLCHMGHCLLRGA